MKINILLIVSLFCFHLNAQIDYFPPLLGNQWDTLSIESLGWCTDEVDNLYATLENGGTKAFLLLKDGKIVLEKYFGDHDLSSNLPWNSAGKTITALMIGVAQENDLLSIQDKTSDYLGTGWTSLPPEQEDSITIWHQLTMTSGLDDSEGFCITPECLTYLADAGTRWAYHNGPYTLLTEVIANASGVSMNSFTNTNLKFKTGLLGAYIPIGNNRVFFGPARGMARMGLLMLNQGNWDGTTVLGDMEYFQQMISPSQELNQSYGFLWWLNGYDSFMLPGSQIVFPGPLSPNAPANGYAGIGRNGQFLDVIPGENIVVVRMGDAPNDDLAPISFHNEMWEHISAIICNPTSTSQTIPEKDILIYPNPAEDVLYIQSPLNNLNISLYNSSGMLIYQQINTTLQIDLQQMPAGIYWLKIADVNGRSITRKIIHL